MNGHPSDFKSDRNKTVLIFVILIFLFLIVAWISDSDIEDKSKTTEGVEQNDIRGREQNINNS